VILRDLLEVQDDKVLFRTLDLLNSWVRIIGNKDPLMQAFVEQGGLDAMSDCQESGNVQIQEAAQFLFG
jgi:hypothetical protein